jgi:hypothetical protein
MIKGEGAFTLTEDQRKARSLIVTIEKVKTGFVYDYFNFSTPEPNTHWGYLQLMARDFVIETQQLEYRRQVVKFWDNTDLDPIEQLRCLVRKTARFMFDLGIELSPIEAPENAQEFLLLELFENDVAHPRIVPTQLLTSVWYKIDEGRSAFVTIDWQGYGLNNCEFAGIAGAPTGEAPKKGESGPGSGGGAGGGGGGQRKGDPPPSGQRGDPGSDSPGPTQGGDIPESPTEETPVPPIVKGPYRVTLFQQNFGGNGPCVATTSGSIQYVVNPGPATVNKTAIPGLGYKWELFDNDGTNLGMIVGGSITGPCDPTVEITDQTYIGP